MDLKPLQEILQESRNKSYKAAVVDVSVITPKTCYRRLCTYEEALEEMIPNLKQYETLVQKAKKMEVDIIAFSEDGLTGFEFLKSEYLLPFTQVFPYRASGWNACQNKGYFGPRSVLVERLSCMAMENGIYLAVNLPRQTYHSEGKVRHFNTDLVFNRKGEIVAVYDKKNLFRTETETFDQPNLELATFQTEFGKFGLMTCFDAMFEHPFLDLVQTQEVDSLVFLTAWQSVPPHLTAVGFHSGLARGKQINYLASNRNYPPKHGSGSGLYTSSGVVASYTSRGTDIQSHLVVARLPVTPARYISTSNQYFHLWPRFEVDWTRFAEREVTRARPVRKTFSVDIFYDKFLMSSGADLEVGGAEYNKLCSGPLCCLLRFTRGGETLRFAVFRGLHTVAGHYFMEICLVTNIPAGSAVEISLAGTFSSADVYPQAGTCRETRLSQDGVFSVDIINNCTDTIAIIARRYDLD